MNTKVSEPVSYSVICRNTSDENLYFYLYQKMPNQPSNTVSVAWLVSSAKVGNRSYFKFDWSENYNLIWKGEGLVQPKKTFNMGGDQPALLDAAGSTKNSTEFTVTDNTPNLSVPTRGETDGQFTIKTLRHVPENKYAVGIGMYNNTTFLQQATPDKTQVFNSNSTYWVGVRSDINAEEVLSQNLADQTKEVVFPQTDIVNYPPKPHIFWTF